jgi:hypothetical protein
MSIASAKFPPICDSSPIFFFLGDDDKLAVLPPSTTGSLSSITTTSLVSEPGGGGAGGTGSDNGDDKSEKHQLTGIKQEKWWQTTIQVAIPFFIAGIGTIGAGIILGHVEVSLRTSRETIESY